MKKTDPEKIKTLEQLVDQGFNARQIARMLGMALSTVQIWARSYRRGYSSPAELMDEYARKAKKPDGTPFKDATERSLFNLHKRGIFTNTDRCYYYSWMRGFPKYFDYEKSLLPKGTTKHQASEARIRKKFGFPTIRAYRATTPAVLKCGGATAYERKVRNARRARPENKLFATFFRQKTAEKGLSYPELAAFLGMVKSTVHSYADGAFLPRPDTALKIFQIFGSPYVTLNQFFEDPDVRRKYGTGGKSG